MPEFSRAQVQQILSADADLRNIDISGIDLSDLDFRKGQLGRTSFRDAKLKGAKFAGKQAAPQHDLRTTLRSAGVMLLVTTVIGGLIAGVVLIGWREIVAFLLVHYLISRPVYLGVGILVWLLFNTYYETRWVLTSPYVYVEKQEAWPHKSDQQYEAEVSWGCATSLLVIAFWWLFLPIKFVSLITLAPPFTFMSSTPRQDAQARRAAVLRASLIDWVYLPSALYAGLRARQRQTLDRLDFTGADMTKVYFAECAVSNSDFTKAKLTKADCRQATFMRCIFTEAELVSTFFKNATFTGCNFQGANLSNANLGGATFSGCRFEGANLNGAQLENIQGLTAVTLLRQSQKPLPGQRKVKSKRVKNLDELVWRDDE